MEVGEGDRERQAGKEGAWRASSPPIPLHVHAMGRCPSPTPNPTPKAHLLPYPTNALRPPPLPPPATRARAHHPPSSHTLPHTFVTRLQGRGAVACNVLASLAMLPFVLGEACTLSAYGLWWELGAASVGIWTVRTLIMSNLRTVLSNPSIFRRPSTFCVLTMCEQCRASASSTQSGAGDRLQAPVLISFEALIEDSMNRSSPWLLAGAGCRLGTSSTSPRTPCRCSAARGTA